MTLHAQAVERNERVARVLDGLAAAIRDVECPVQFSPLLMEARKLLSGELAAVPQSLVGVERPEDVARAGQPQEGWLTGALAGLDDRLDRLLLKASDGERFVLSKDSARNIVEIAREWLRNRLPASPRAEGK